MDNMEFARRLVKVQDELETLSSYLEHNYAIALIKKALQPEGLLLSQTAHCQHVQPHLTRGI